MRFTRKFCLSSTDAMNGMDVVFLRNRHLGTTLFGDVILECHCKLMFIMEDSPCLLQPSHRILIEISLFNVLSV